MKINKLQNQIIENSLYNKVSHKRPVGVDIKTDNSVNIQISDSAKTLINKINQSEETNYSEKVEGIRRAILEGNYKVSSEDIADRIIKAMEEQKESDI